MTVDRDLRPRHTGAAPCPGCRATDGEPHGADCDVPRCAACGDSRESCCCRRTPEEIQAMTDRVARTGNG